MIVILAILLVGVRFVGLSPYAVLSGSMEPSYHVGSLIYVDETEAENIEEGDTITFVMDNSLTIVTHRVVEIDEVNNCFFTKGDANNTRDGAPVHYENIVGVVKFSLPLMGYVSNFIMSNSGKYIVMGVIAMLMLISLLSNVFNKDKKI